MNKQNESSRRNFLGTGLGAALAVLAAKGFNVTEIRAEKGDLITVAGITSADGLRPHVHEFEATLDLKTGAFSGTTTSTISVGKEPSGPHPHNIAATVADALDFDVVVNTSETSGHTHRVRPN